MNNKEMRLQTEDVVGLGYGPLHTSWLRERQTSFMVMSLGPQLECEMLCSSCGQGFSLPRTTATRT